jgi:hypothetical protein
MVVSFWCERAIVFCGLDLVVQCLLPLGFLICLFWVGFLEVSLNFGLVTFCFGCLCLGSFGFVWFRVWGCGLVAFE